MILKREPTSRLFLAAPLSTSSQREFNESIATLLSETFSVFLPQRDVGLLAELERLGLSPKEARRRVFEEDLDGLQRSDVVLAVLESPLISGGVAMELGIAYILGKACVGLHSPARHRHGGKSNPLLETALTEVFEDLDQLTVWSRNYRLSRFIAAG